jgi:hypothetical protein
LLSSSRDDIDACPARRHLGGDGLGEAVWRTVEEVSDHLGRRLDRSTVTEVYAP